MDKSLYIMQIRPWLYYRATCPRCRVISRLLTLGSLGLVRRVPMATTEAQRVYADYGQEQRRPALYYRGLFVTGWRILPAIGAAMLQSPFVLVHLGVRAAGARMERTPAVRLGRETGFRSRVNTSNGAQ
jgi:hypothetical protein